MSQTVLLIHGQPGSARDWEPLVTAIGNRAPTIAIDRPGWDGRSRAGDLRHNADAAAAALDRAGVETATVVGLSFGGAVAAWLALDRPERVNRLVLVSPSANAESIEWIDRLLAAPVAGYAASAALLSGVALALTSGLVRRFLESTYSLPDDYLRHSSAPFRGRRAWDAFVIEQRALLRDLPVLERRLSEISAPTTVVIGSRDTIVPPAAGRKLSEQIPGAELVEIHGGHHILPAERPSAVAEAILGAR